MIVSLIDYPLRQRLAGLRSQIDGGARETLLPEHEFVLANVASPEKAREMVHGAICSCLAQYVLSPQDVTTDNPLIRAFLIVRGQPGILPVEISLDAIADDRVRDELIKLSLAETWEWDVERLEWQLVQALQFGWPDLKVRTDLPLFRQDFGDASHLLQTLLLTTTARAWGLL